MFYLGIWLVLTCQESQTYRHCLEHQPSRWIPVHKKFDKQGVHRRTQFLGFLRCRQPLNQFVHICYRHKQVLVLCQLRTMSGFYHKMWQQHDIQSDLQPRLGICDPLDHSGPTDLSRYGPKHRPYPRYSRQIDVQPMLQRKLTQFEHLPKHLSERETKWCC